MELELNKIHHLDNREGLPLLPEKCCHLLISDPPYFEVKGDFDFVWKSFDEYLEFMEGQAKLYKKILADNGTLFVWGNSKRIAYIQVIFDKYFNLENSMVWRKIDSMQYQYYSVELSRCFNTHNERLLMYSNEIECTGLQQITRKSYNSFLSIRNHINECLHAVGLAYNSEPIINALLSSGIYSSRGSCIANARNKLYINSISFEFMTESFYNSISNILSLKPYIELKKEYRSLRKEYEGIIRYFNNTNKLEEVLEFSQQSQISKNYDHDTIKPEKLTRALILTCSRPNDLVVVPFAGSGTECAMAAKEGRRFIGFETTEKHVVMSNKRAEIEMSKPDLFRQAI